jgi:hypothetical protein
VVAARSTLWDDLSQVTRGLAVPSWMVGAAYVVHRVHTSGFPPTTLVTSQCLLLASLPSSGLNLGPSLAVLSHTP